MWARILEMILSLWLLVSPWIGGSTTYLEEFFLAAAIFFFAFLSYWREKAHLFHLLIAIRLGFIAFYQKTSLPYPVQQNYLILALLLLFLSLVPSYANSPPKAWIEFQKKKGNRYTAS